MKEKKLGLSGYLHVRESYDELEDLEPPKKPKWCGEHKPLNSDFCPVHDLRWEEAHILELKREYAVDAVFYCPEFGCDEFDWSAIYNELCPWANGSKESKAVFRNHVRLKIFFPKLGELKGDEK